MKKLIKYTGCFLLPIMLVIVLIELFYRVVPTNYTFKHEAILKNRDTIEVLTFGDSHAMYGINPRYISGHVFNLANLSQTVYFDELLFNKYVDRLTNLKSIIIPMEYTTMSQEDNTQEDVWRKYFYESQMDLKVPLIKWYDPKKYSLALSQKLVRTVKALNIYRHNNTLVNCDQRGWGLGYNTAIDSIELKRLAPIISRKHNDNKIDISQNAGRIESIIKTCQTKNINVLLVNLPVTPSYYKLLNKEEVRSILSQSQEFNNTFDHVRHLDLLQDERFKQDDFHDADHLNKKGAKKCSIVINEFLNND